MQAAGCPGLLIGRSAKLGKIFVPVHRAGIGDNRISVGNSRRQGRGIIIDGQLILICSEDKGCGKIPCNILDNILTVQEKVLVQIFQGDFGRSPQIIPIAGNDNIRNINLR